MEFKGVFFEVWTIKTFYTRALKIWISSLFVALPSLLSLLCLSFFFLFIYFFSHFLDSGNRAQLSAEAGQRRPSQKEKYVSPIGSSVSIITSHPSPLPHKTSGLDESAFWFAWLRCFKVCVILGVPWRPSHPIRRPPSAWECMTDPMKCPFSLASMSWSLLFARRLIWMILTH